MKAKLKKLVDMTDTPFYERPSLAPMMYIAKMATLDFGKNGKYTIAIYGAYNAMGLIGTEQNGICVLDDVRKCVLLDQHQGITSGMDTPTARQLKAFDEVLESKWEDFQSFVNNHPRSRHPI